MKWVALALAAALAVFALSAFVSRDESCTGGGGRYSGPRECVVTYWWD